MISIAHKHWSSIYGSPARSHPDAVCFALHSAHQVRARCRKPPTSQWFHAYRLAIITHTLCGRRAAYDMCISDMATAPSTESSSIQTVCCSCPARRTGKVAPPARVYQAIARSLVELLRRAALELWVGHSRMGIPLIWTRG